MRTTIKDIAIKTGLSVTTISLVLNGKGDKIPKSTQEYVLSAAKELNYRPNQLAVGLVKKRTKTLGLIISDVSNVFFANLSKCIEGECRRLGWNLILCNTNDYHERDLEYIQVLADKGVDGILYCMALDSDSKKGQKSIAMMNGLRIPFILIDRYIEGVNECTVIGDHYYGGYIATKHLLELGHTKIGCASGPTNLEDSKARLRGYKTALDEYELPFYKEMIFEGKYDEESGRDAAAYFSAKEITAIFAFNDMMAYGIYKGLKERNITVPHEISLIGYDDIYFSQILDVPLTTVHQQVYEMGTEAVQQLISEVETGIKVRKSITFKPQLVVRESTQKIK